MKTLITYFRRNVVLVLLSCVWVNATAVVTNFPFIESFEASSTTLADWSQVMEVGTAEWTFVNGSNGGGISDAYVGTRNARFIGNGDLGFRTKLVSPPLNLSDIVLPKLSFFLGQQVWKSKQNTTRLFYRTSVSSPWIQLEYYTQSMDDWTGFELTLPEASATYQIAFEGANFNGYANVIDWVEVYEGAFPTTVKLFPFVETFETSSATLKDWRQSHVEGTHNLTFAGGADGFGGIKSAYEGERNAKFTTSSAMGYSTQLISPMFDLSKIASPKLSFYLGQENWSGSQNTTKVLYRRNARSKWVELAHYTQSIAEWTLYEFILPSPTSTYQIAFEAINYFGRPIVIDLVKVYDPSTGIHSPEAADAMLVYMDGDLLKLVNVSHAPASIQVYNLVGELVMLGETNGNTHTSLNVSTLVNGIYVVCVVQDNGVMLSRKVSIYR